MAPDKVCEIQEGAGLWEGAEHKVGGAEMCAIWGIQPTVCAQVLPRRTDVAGLRPDWRVRTNDSCYVQLPRSRPALVCLPDRPHLAQDPAPGLPRPSFLRARGADVTGDRCAFPVLVAGVQRQHVARLRWPRRTSCTLGCAHLLHPLAKLRLCLCQPPGLLLHAHCFLQACLGPARCCPRPPRARPRPLPDEDPPTPSIASLSRLSYTTISTLGPG